MMKLDQTYGVKMKNKLWLVALLISAITIMSVAGCGASVAQNPTSSSPEIASETTSPVSVNVCNQQGIWVSGQGKATVIPDIATFDLGVSVRGTKVTDAQSQAADAMNKVIASLTSDGVDQKDISTRYYTISPVLKYDNMGQQSTITGYEVSNIVKITIRSIEKVGTIIDGVTAVGGDAIRVNSMTFSVDKPEQYYSQARNLAVNDAKAKAQHLASLAGVTLGLPFYISENANFPLMPYDTSIRSLEGASPTTPITPGQTDVVLNVQVAYTIQ